MDWRCRCLLAVSAGLYALTAAAAPEARFSLALDQLAAGHSAEALRTLEELATTEPDFTLGREFFVEARSRLQRKSGAAELSALADEGRIRLSSERALPADGTVPAAVLQIAPGFRHLIAVDLPRARLYVLENRDGALHLVRSHYAAMGRQGWGKRSTGDLRTPIGVYHITGWIDDADLPPLYGSGAFPIDYPNAWDRRQERTGYGIWLHGVPTPTGVRAPRSSEGCVTMSNADLSALRAYVEFGQTPVLLSEDLRWTKPATQRADRDLFAARVEAWRSAAASGDKHAYLKLYAQSFRDGNGADYNALAQTIGTRNDGISPGLRIDDLSLYWYPGGGDQLLLAEFTTTTGAGDAAQRARRQLYWKLESDGEWRIVREDKS